MKKIALSLTASMFFLGACGESNNEETPQAEEPELNIGNGNENDPEPFNGDSVSNDEDEIDSILQQGIGVFELHITLVDESEWSFTYTPPQSADEQADAMIHSEEIDIQGEAAASEMEELLADLHFDAASDMEVITEEIAETFDFNEGDIQEYTLMIHFPQQDSPTEWTYNQG
ncbi:YusW family protein [Alkalicoccus halolimnae]|uniref:YusW family protein n=1 Tax=Alkalicoccus halolimnae TaxID=1667239 RepID=A0A5C7FHF7_9BACI|nr:YusW family protein [Alkalicoccus halolimnae]TXF85579.1 hypothetical protein FTX54_08295 [Alkalicoccus halolimnae]